jgi:hypothetical protein
MGNQNNGSLFTFHLGVVFLRLNLPLKYLLFYEMARKTSAKEPFGLLSGAAWSYHYRIKTSTPASRRLSSDIKL